MNIVLKSILQYLGWVLSLVVWEIESPIAAAVGQVRRVRVLDVVGNVVQAEEHGGFRQSFGFPRFVQVALAVGCALVWNVVLSARLSGGDWRGPPQSHPSLALLPSLVRVLFNPDLFGPSIVTWFLLLFLWYSPIHAIVKCLQTSPFEECPTG